MSELLQIAENRSLFKLHYDFFGSFYGAVRKLTFLKKLILILMF